MSLKFRRYLYIFFIIAFLAITPLVSFYAVGYKLNSRFALERTGALIIDSKPRGANINLAASIDRELFGGLAIRKKRSLKTPAKIKNLLPGEYTVSLELDGYWPWQKKLYIHPGQSTFAETISLFKNTLPLSLERGEYSAVAYAPRSSEAVLIGEDTATLFNLQTEEAIYYRAPTSTRPVFGDPASAPRWSPPGDRVIVGTLVFKTDGWDKPQDLTGILGKNSRNIKWGAEGRGFYFQADNGLYFHDPTTGAHKTVAVAAGLADYTVKNGNIFLVYPAEQTAELAVLNRNFETIRRISLPNSEYAFLDQETALLNLYDKRHRILYLIDPLSEIRPLKDSLNNVTLAEWTSQNNLIYANDFELWQYDGQSGRKTLLTRISRPIADIFHHPSGNYVIFTTADSVNVIELDDRERRNITELFGAGKIDFAHLNERGDVLYFYAQIGALTGLHKMAIQ